MRVPSFHAFRAGRAGVAASLNKLWSWGANNAGQLGLGNTTNRSSPVQVGALTDWAEVFGGANCSFATKTDGTLWAWGSNNLGKLGLGNTTYRSSPVQVGALTDWSGAKISSRYQSTLAVKSNGTLWGWGLNNYFQLGLGNNTNRSSPVQVGALTNWADVSVSQNSTLAVKTDGTLWSWGLARYGALGLGDYNNNRSSPVQVGALTGWSKVVVTNSNSALALKTNGTLWSWGGNEYGQLGLGDIISRSSPVQVGALTNWSKIAGAGSRYSYAESYFTSGFFSAIKTDGTLWSWGDNTYGKLGLGNTISRSSPVQVGALTTWSSLSINQAVEYKNTHNTAVIKTDGTLWAWGSNVTGSLATGGTTPFRRSSPVQVLSGTSGWTSVSVICGDAQSYYSYFSRSSMLAIRTS